MSLAVNQGETAMQIKDIYQRLTDSLIEQVKARYKSRIRH
ncbi:hypothetical protein USDA257_c30100 [Sinorhizobium fredii USDA 257]|uniref:Uncharacterized protein n=1 Tax=Sinorhizobium fredii (strain USDA 257) TaxID=1185652 RepID=I3X6S4_SINF2|nr:hypothetical protein USDA257_c30100 [Sinorhizobium fredii USDA 257]